MKKSANTPRRFGNIEFARYLRNNIEKRPSRFEPIESSVRNLADIAPKQTVVYMANVNGKASTFEAILSLSTRGIYSIANLMAYPSRADRNSSSDENSEPLMSISMLHIERYDHWSHIELKYHP